MGSVVIYALTIFIGAFLLFQVQPLIGKFILPWFGGTPAVWTTCMLFFQLLLLGGYAYVHVTSRWLKPRTQAIMHLVLLAAALTLLPITPPDSLKPDGGGNPTMQILVLLASTIGLPYFVLSATGPLMQHWLSRTHPGVSPYRLYALSNVGSLLALISFPIYFETHFTRKMQAALWAGGLVAYSLGCALCVVKLWRLPSTKKNLTSVGQAEAPAPTLMQQILWLLLPACASVLLLATTNKLCQEVAVIPFLWVLPLSLYLLSFIICFDNPRWYVRPVFLLALTVSWGVCWLFVVGVAAPVNLQLIFYSLGFFVCCMVCHGELYRLKPDPSRLTAFYLMMAAGGALGGLFVAVVAPLIFTDYLELPWGLFLCGTLLLIVCARVRKPREWKHWRWLECTWVSASLIAFSIVLWRQTQQLSGLRIVKLRNFYGVLTVTSHGSNGTDDQRFELTHGLTLHGMQFTAPRRAAEPTLYFVDQSGVGLAMRALSLGHRRIGVIGLGVGTLAAYARALDYFHIYEINAEVVRLANSRFTYLSNCLGKVEITLGDARLSLEKEPAQEFDLLVLDAFNSDAIPVHLVTEEAFLTYERHLKPNGIIAVHVTNRSLNLEPVVANLAGHFKYKLATIDFVKTPDQWWTASSVWMLLSHQEQVIDSPEIWLASRPPEMGAVPIPLWTDDFASLFQILRSEKVLHIDPAFTGAQTRIANKLCQQGDFVGAINSYRAALETHPNMPDLINNFAWLLAACPNPRFRNGAQAITYAELSCKLTHYKQTITIGTLAAAYAEAGRFDDAIAAARKACALAAKNGEASLLQKNQELLEVYRKHRPYPPEAQ